METSWWCVVAVWRIRIHPVRVVSALIGGFLDRRAGIHCQLPETQRYKRYRNLPYPHLAPKMRNSRRNQSIASTRVQAKTVVSSKVTTRARRRAINGKTETRKSSRSSRRHREEIKSRRKERSKSPKRTKTCRMPKVLCASIFHSGAFENITTNAFFADGEQQTRRVLRARGISSYTEQLYSDYETEEDELEEWTDVEAVYAAPGAQTDTSASHTASKDRHTDDWSDEEDSDQDWILPGSRKRKNKRPCESSRNTMLPHFSVNNRFFFYLFLMFEYY